MTANKIILDVKHPVSLRLDNFLKSEPETAIFLSAHVMVVKVIHITSKAFVLYFQ